MAGPMPDNVKNAILALLRPWRPELTAAGLEGWLAQLPRGRGQSMEALEGLMTCGEASRLLGVNVRTLQRWVKRAGLVPARRVGGHGKFGAEYYRMADLRALATPGAEAGAAPP